MRARDVRRAPHLSDAAADDRPARRALMPGAGATLLIAALAAGVLGCDSGRTYYAIQYCPKLCDYVCEAGHTHLRYRIPLIEESFTALTEQQDVIMKSGCEISSLTKDQHMTCRVQGQRNCDATATRLTHRPKRT
jgi:hypothetical protein